MSTKPSSVLSALALPLAIVVSGAFVTTLLAVQLSADNLRNVNSAVAKVSEETIAKLESRLQRYEYGLRGARGVIITGGADGITREAFHRYSASRNPDVEFPGARGFGFIRRVPKDKEAAFVALAKRDGAPGFAVHGFAPNEGERFIIQYLEPQRPNVAAIGLDIATEKNRADAAMSALRSGKATLSGPITLVQATGKPNQSFLFLLPIYKGVGLPDNESARVASGFGWSYAPINMNEVLGDLGLKEESLHLTLRDVTNPQAATDFYHSAPRLDVRQPLQTQSVTRELYGRKWELLLEIYPPFVSALNLSSPRSIVVIGGLATIATTMLVFALGLSRNRKKQLALAASSLGAIVESSDDGIIGKQLDGVINSWNAGATRIFGFTAQEAIGRKVVDLIVPEDRAHEEVDILQRIANGERIKHFETQRKRSDGSLIDVAVTVSPIHDNAGHVIGASKTVRDITLQKEAQRQIIAANDRLEEQVALRTSELHASQRTLRTVLDAVPSMIGYWDKQLINRVANKAYDDWFGVDPGSLPGTPLQALLGEKIFEANRPYIEGALRGEPQTFERSIPHPSGTVRHSLAHYLPDVLDGEVRGFYVLIHNVTDIVESRMKLDAVLRENQQLLSTINQQMLYSVTDREGNILDVNEHFCTTHGYAREALIGNNHRIVKSGQHGAEFWRALWAQLSSGQAWHGVICNLGKDGRPLWFDTVIAPMVGQDGKADRYVALRIDITDRKQTEAEAERLNVLLSTVLKAATEIAVIATALDGTVTVFNKGAQRLLGYSESEVLGSKKASRFHVREEVLARAAELSSQFGKPIDGSNALVYVSELVGAETREWNYVRKDGSHVPVSLSMTTLRDSDEQLVGYLGIAIDITQRRAYEEGLRRAKQLAEEAAATKGQFLANMSHEIRTPMNAVLGMLQLVQGTQLNDRQLDYISKAQGAAKSLLGLLNDILDFSKIDAGKLELDSYPVEIETVLRDLAVVLGGNQTNRNVEVVFDIDSRLPTAVQGDRLRLLQILINLAGNAMKFTQHGQVIVRVSQLSATEHDVALRFEVTDTGIGMTPGQLGRIFQGFTQAEASTTRRFGGTGLGLVISQRLVALMGGTLQVQSDFGKGSRFWFDVTLKTAEYETALSALSVAPDLRVLAVDDNPTVGAILANTLRDSGWSLDFVTNGQDGIARVRDAITRGHPYDIVLMDWRMPGMDGLTTANRMRQEFGPEAAPVVIMVTAFGREVLADAEKEGEVPFVDFLTKPVTPQQLFDAVHRALFAQDSGADKVRAVPELRRLDGMRLLLVEDNALNRQVAYELLTAEGASVLMAEGGVQGVQMATQEASAFDVVIMDVQMPDIDGMEATRRIRAHATGKALPILAMTANASAEDRADCLAAGMNEHVGKPIDMEEIVPTLIRLARWVPLAVPVGSDAAVKPDNDGLVEPLAVVLKRLGGRLPIYRSLLNEFRPAVERMLSELQTHVYDGDMRQAGAVMHSLKGMAATVGAADLARRASALEKHARHGKDAVVTQVFSTDVLTALAQSLEASNSALLKALPDDPASSSDSLSNEGPASLSGAQLLEQLSDMEALLALGSMRALDEVEALVSQLNTQQLHTLHDFVHNVRQMQFSLALEALQKFRLEST